MHWQIDSVFTIILKHNAFCFFNYSIMHDNNGFQLIYILVCMFFFYCLKKDNVHIKIQIRY